MTFVYLAAFIGGMLFAVWVMMYGVERPRAAHPAGERSFRLSPPIVIAFSVSFGAVGALLTRSNAGTVATRLLISILVGIFVAIVSARLVKKWWAVTPEHDVDDERYVLQGLRARSFDDGALAAGTEVVIERIEDDVAYVEAWMEVEKRL